MGNIGKFVDDTKIEQLIISDNTMESLGIKQAILEVQLNGLY